MKKIYFYIAFILLAAIASYVYFVGDGVGLFCVCPPLGIKFGWGLAVLWQQISPHLSIVSQDTECAFCSQTSHIIPMDFLVILLALVFWKVRLPNKVKF